MAQYTIKEVETITGVKAHTLRVWEKRYQICDPTRDDQNKRCYSEAEMRHLVKISHLNQRGHKISALAKLSCQDLELLYKEACEYGESGCCFIDKMTLSLQGFHETLLLQLLANQLAKGSLRDFYEHAYVPMCDRIDFLLMSGALSDMQAGLFERTVGDVLLARRHTATMNISSCAPSVLLVFAKGQEPIEVAFLATALADAGIPSVRFGYTREHHEDLAAAVSKHTVLACCLHDGLSASSINKIDELSLEKQYTLSLSRRPEDSMSWIHLYNSICKFDEQDNPDYISVKDSITFAS